MKDQNEPWFYINDLEGFVDNSRQLVFKFFGQSNEIADDSLTASLASLGDLDQEELDKTISHEEATVIIKNRAKIQINRKSKQKRYCINDEILQLIIEDLNSRMVSNILTKLVADGVIESAFDTEKNDFIFWVKEEDDQNSKPETD
jgi:hypothetical protein